MPRGPMLKTKPHHTMFLLITFVITLLASLLYILVFVQRNDTIRVGILHSQTGVMALAEQPVIDATLLAIEEINNSRKLLGKFIEPIIVDGASDTLTFYAKANNLITKERVDVIFGCWISDTRKAVKTVVEKYNNLLFYPIQYEGIEVSPNIAYVGSTANQLILPTISWVFYNFGKKFYLIGSNNIYSRVFFELAKNYAQLLGAEIVGEQYLSPKDNFDTIAQDIIRTHPTIIINTIASDSNLPLFKALQKSRITADKTPVVTFGISELEMKKLEIALFANNYIASSYFQSLENQENKHFINRFKKKYGSHRAVNEAMVNAYTGVYLWAQAVEQAQTSDPNVIKKIIKGEGKNTPAGITYIDPSNNHAWKTARIGKISPDGEIHQVWTSKNSLQPIPFPSFNDYIWEGFLDRFYKKV